MLDSFSGDIAKQLTISSCASVNDGMLVDVAISAPF